MAAKLYVGNLPYSVPESKLQDVFSQYGTVVSVRIITDKFTGRSKGFGFVEMESKDQADRAAAALNGSELDGRTIVVNEARPEQPRSPKGGHGRAPRQSRW